MLSWNHEKSVNFVAHYLFTELYSEYYFENI